MVNADLNSYMRIAERGSLAEVSLKKTADGDTVAATRGRLGQFLVKVMGFFGLAPKLGPAINHFRITLDKAYEGAVADKALQRGELGYGTKVTLTGAKVRQVLEFAAEIKRDATTTRHQTAAVETNAYIKRIKSSDSGQGPEARLKAELNSLSPQGLAHFKHGLSEALVTGGFLALDIPRMREDPKLNLSPPIIAAKDLPQVDKLAATLIAASKKIDEKGAVPDVLAAAKEADEAMGAVLRGVKSFDATGVLSGTLRIARSQARFVELGGKSDPKAMNEMVNKMLAELPPRDLPQLRNNVTLMLRAAEVADGSRHGDDKIIGGEGNIKVLQMLKSEIYKLQPFAVTEDYKIDTTSFQGLAATADMMDAVISFGGKPEEMPQYRAFNVRVGEEVGKFMKASAGATKLPRSLSPIFKKLFSPQKPQDVRAAVNILKKHFDGKIYAAAGPLAAAVNIWESGGDWSVNMQEPEKQKYKAAVENGNKAWEKGIVPIDAHRSQMVNLTALMRDRGGDHTKAGAELLEQMLTFYPWPGANEKSTPALEDTAALMTIPREFQMAAEGKGPLGAGWRIRTAALSGQFIKRHVKSLGEDMKSMEKNTKDMKSIVKDMKSMGGDMKSMGGDMKSIVKDMKSIVKDMRSMGGDMESPVEDMKSPGKYTLVPDPDRGAKISRVDINEGRAIDIATSFVVDLPRMDMSIVVDGKAVPLFPVGQHAAGSGNETRAVAGGVEKLADYVGDEKRLLGLSGIIHQGTFVDAIMAYNRGDMMSPMFASGAAKHLSSTNKQGPDIVGRTNFVLEKIDENTFKLSGSSHAYVQGVGGVSGDMNHMSMLNSGRITAGDKPGLITEEEVLLRHTATGWNVSVLSERIEIDAAV